MNTAWFWNGDAGDAGWEEIQSHCRTRATLASMSFSRLVQKPRRLTFLRRNGVRRTPFLWVELDSCWKKWASVASVISGTSGPHTGMVTRANPARGPAGIWRATIGIHIGWQAVPWMPMVALSNTGQSSLREKRVPKGCGIPRAAAGQWACPLKSHTGFKWTIMGKASVSYYGLGLGMPIRGLPLLGQALVCMWCPIPFPCGIWLGTLSGLCWLRN